MEDPIVNEKSAFDNTNNDPQKDAESKYVDCIRLVEGGNIRRFEIFVQKFDVVDYELNDENGGPTKPLLFYTIEHNDEAFLKYLLDMEVPLNKSYSVSRTLICISISSIS